jgi:hypothetical protein
VQKDTYNIVKDVGHGLLVMGTRLPERLLFDKSKTLSLGISQMEGGIDPLSLLLLRFLYTTPTRNKLI